MSGKPWRLTRQAEASLVDIALWAYETFASRQPGNQNLLTFRRQASIPMDVHSVLPDGFGCANFSFSEMNRMNNVVRTHS